MMMISSIFENIPAILVEEKFESIFVSPNVRVERILSLGHASPSEGWYDQTENEWVMVLRGHGKLEFEDGSEVEMKPGDYIDIPAHKKHRVVWTNPNDITIWLAIFYR